jgi:anion-transporting  ArsA/GET3 family ATPase
VIVTGKGGTGKTTVVAALALAAAGAGRRVLVVETTRGEHLPRLIGAEGPPVGYAGRELRPGVRGMRIDPFEALAEYLGLQLKARPLVDLVVGNRGFRQLMGAAPGWRELITLGKVWHLEQMREGKRPKAARSEAQPSGGRTDGRPKAARSEAQPSGGRRSGQSVYDLIVVDAPATGHGVTFLDVPRVVVSAVRAGPLRRHAGYVEAMVADAERTLLLPVALAEELPARETAELVERLRDAIGIAVDRVVVNGVAGAPFPPGLEDLDERLARLPGDLDLRPLPAPRELVACARHLRSRHELNERYVGEIARLTGLPIVRLPYLIGGIDGPEDVAALCEPLLEPPRQEAV